MATHGNTGQRNASKPDAERRDGMVRIRCKEADKARWQVLSEYSGHHSLSHWIERTLNSCAWLEGRYNPNTDNDPLLSAQHHAAEALESVNKLNAVLNLGAPPDTIADIMRNQVMRHNVAAQTDLYRLRFVISHLVAEREKQE